MSLILGVEVARTNYDQVIARTLTWVSGKESRSLAFANVHVLMEAYDDRSFRECLAKFDLVNPDGVPLVWALKMLGHKEASRVYGPDCMVAMLEAAADKGISVGFYGGSPEVLNSLLDIVRERHPDINIGFAYSPPFRPMTAEEDALLVEQIKTSGVQVLFVGLGCPKQERWVIEHAGRLPVVMYAVGAAFDFLAGTKKQAPRWMMRNGLEWAFRFATEPRRLAKRYLKHNPRFIMLLTRQLLRSRSFAAN